MITVKVTAGNGDNWITRINCDLAEATAYFMGNAFVNENSETGEETRSTVVKVEQV